MAIYLYQLKNGETQMQLKFIFKHKRSEFFFVNRIAFQRATD